MAVNIQTTQAGLRHPEGLDLTGPRGEARGYVDPIQAGGAARIEDLWIMQGSICDLKCKHCYVGSSPDNHRLEQITFRELRPHLDDAARFGVRTIYFTGGEPFVNAEVLQGRAQRNGQNEEFLQNLTYALGIAPVEILTNGRRYIRQHLDALDALREKHGDRLRLRVTLESWREREHDALRGATTFRQTLETLTMLTARGFRIIIAAERPFLGSQSNEEILAAYAALFSAHAITAEVTLIENVMAMGHELVRIRDQGKEPSAETFITTACFDTLGKPAETLMCHFSRCIQKIDGRLRYYPCPVIYDDPKFDLGGGLQESLRRVYLAHRNCYDYCMKGRGASCRTETL